MKNNFRKNGNMRIRFETPEERTGIIRILEERGFRIDEKLKQMTDIPPWDNRTFDVNLKRKEYTYGVPSFIGAAMMSSGIRFWSAQEFFRIAGLGFKTVPRFPVFHVPHNGRDFPRELMESVCVPEDMFLQYHEKMRDTDISFAVPEVYRGGDMCRTFRVSRLLCDVERFIGEEETMEAYGMGFCYEKAYDGTVIRHVTDEIREKTLRYYREHHAWMDDICERHPRILLFDMHSYSDGIIPEPMRMKDAGTPDLCIGTEDRYTPPELLRIVRERFSGAGFRTAVNVPYSGCFVPNAVLSGKSRCDCIGLMLEFHKRTYCDTQGRPVPEKLDRIRRIILQVMTDCADLD